MLLKVSRVSFFDCRDSHSWGPFMSHLWPPPPLTFEVRGGICAKSLIVLLKSKRELNKAEKGNWEGKKK